MTMTTSRRMLIGAAAASALFGPSTVRAQEATPVSSGGVAKGIAGGGTLQGIGGSEVPFVLSVFSLPDGSVQGIFRLEDNSTPSIPVLVEGQRFDLLEPLSEKAPGDRRIVGWATLNGAGEYPYLLQVLFSEDGAELNLVLGADAEPFISAAAAKNCDCGGFSYGIRSAVTTGDVVQFGG